MRRLATTGPTTNATENIERAERVVAAAQVVGREVVDHRRARRLEHRLAEPEDARAGAEQDRGRDGARHERRRAEQRPGHHPREGHDDGDAGAAPPLDALEHEELQQDDDDGVGGERVAEPLGRDLPHRAGEGRHAGVELGIADERGDRHEEQQRAQPRVAQQREVGDRLGPGVDRPLDPVTGPAQRAEQDHQRRDVAEGVEQVDRDERAGPSRRRRSGHRRCRRCRSRG